MGLLYPELVKHIDSTWVEQESLIEICINSLVVYASGKLPFKLIYRCPIRIPVNLTLGTIVTFEIVECISISSEDLEGFIAKNKDPSR